MHLITLGYAEARMSSQVYVLTGREVAARLGVSARTVEGWRRYGTGPPYCKVGRVVRYAVMDLEAWMATTVVLPRKPLVPAVVSSLSADS
jgi:predicted DNA-binding transcriptional regulator AlpA